MPQAELKYAEPMQDGRRKLNPALHEEIREKKKTTSSAKLAKEYGVSEALIKYIVYPARQASMKARNKRVWKDYSIHYGKDYHAKAIKSFRAKKRQLGLVYNPCPIKPTKRICEFCGKEFEAIGFKKYCDPKHRFAVYKRKDVLLCKKKK